MPRRRHRRLFLLAMLAWLVMAFGAQAMPCGCGAAAAGMDHAMAMAHGGDHARPDGHAHAHGACTCAMACAAVAGVPLSSQPRHPRVTGANPPMAVQASVGDFTQTPLLRPPSA
jgi:hypothetical protein